MKNITFTLLLLISFQISWSQYKIYESPRNEINQAIIRTSDGGFLIGAIQFCYTPEEWVIEGCPLGIRLIKTTAIGDTIWTSEIPNPNVQGNVHIFENRDGTYSLFTSQDETFTCQGWQIGPDVGLFQLVTYHLSETGGVISQSSFPDDCHLPLVTVTQLSDTTYVALATYLEPFASDTIEGRLYLLDHKGIAIDSASVSGQSFFKADVVIDSLNRILVFFVNTDSVGVLQIYDQELNLIEQKMNVQFSTPCMTAEESRGSMIIQQNGNLFYMCDNPFGKGKNVEVFAFTTDLAIVGHKLYEIPLSVGFTEDEDGEIIILSEMRNEEDSSNITLTYLTSVGDSIETISLRIPGNQLPTQILAFEDERLAIAGSHNCCNLNTDIGPGATFLYLQDEISSVANERNDFPLYVFPNPATEILHVQSTIPDTELSARIYSSTGLLMKDIYEVDQYIHVNDLPAGIYFLLVRTPDNRQSRIPFVKMDK